MQTAVIPPPSLPQDHVPTDEEIGQLCREWLEAKGREQQANADRLAIEQRIDNLLASELGAEESTPLKRAGFKVSITHSLTRKLDVERAKAILATFPAEIGGNLIKVKHEGGSTGLKWLAAHRPDLYGQLAPALETKPAKSAIKVEEAKK